MAKAFSRVLWAQEAAALAQRNVDIACNLRDATQKRVEAGAASPLEVLRAETVLTNAQAAATGAETELSQARSALAALWGSAKPGFTSAAGEEAPGRELPPLEKLMAAVEANAELRAAQLQVRRLETARALLKAQRYPDLTLRGGWRYLAGEPGQTFVFGLGLPLPLFNRNQGAIQQKEAQIAQAKWRYLSTATELAAQLRQAYEKYRAALANKQLFQGTLVPKAEEAFKKIQEGFAQGSFTLLDALHAHSDLLEARQSYLTVPKQLRDARSEIERILGLPLFPIQPKREERHETHTQN